MVYLAQLIGGIIGIAIAGSIFSNSLAKYIPQYAPGIPPEFTTLVRQSVTVIFQLPPEVQPGVIKAYVKSVDDVFLLGVPAGALASLSAL